MSGTAVVCDNVHDDLDAFRMGLVHHLLVEGVVAEARVDVIVIAAGIAVIRLVRLIVQQQRRAPKGRRAEVGDVIEMVDDTLDITAVARHRILPVHLVGRLRDNPGDVGAIVIDAARPAFVVLGTG